MKAHLGIPKKGVKGVTVGECKGRKNDEDDQTSSMKLNAALETQITKADRDLVEIALLAGQRTLNNYAPAYNSKCPD